MAGVNVFEVLAPGIVSTVQDLGRFGGARYGVATSGALDGFALRAGNLLVGNDESAAAVETTLMGLRIKVLRDALVAVTGGDLQPRTANGPLPMWRSHLLREGEVLVFAGPACGLRAYLAVAGGIQVAPVLGSRSTNLASGFGGFEGRALRQGDILAAAPAPDPLRGADRAFPPEALPVYASPWRLRIVWGPQDDHFSEEGRQTFVAAAFTVSPSTTVAICALIPVSDTAGTAATAPPSATAVPERAAFASSARRASTIRAPQRVSIWPGAAFWLS